jgi:SAM-dependent methyltransferase
MGEPMNYDDYATRYRHNRSAVPWLLAPLDAAARALEPGSQVVEVGCGTGNYVVALSEALPALQFSGFDLSDGMLQQARSRGSSVTFLRGNADERFPCSDGSAALVFAVDVLHHLTNYERFYQEARRVLLPSGVFIVLTSCRDDVLGCSLTRLFPEVADIQLRRYPDLDELAQSAAARCGLREVSRAPARGTLEISPEFIRRLEEKCASSLRLIEDAAHQRGMSRVREAGARGELWQSRYTSLTYAVAREA